VIVKFVSHQIFTFTGVYNALYQTHLSAYDNNVY